MKAIPVLFAAILAAGLSFAEDPEPPTPTPTPPAPPAESPAEFPTDARTTLRQLVADQVTPALREAKIPAGPGIVIAPIYGDRDNEVRNLLKNAVTDAGLVCVEASDDMWTAIMKELGFNEGFKDLIDPATMTRIDRHFASRILLYGRVRTERERRGRLRGTLSSVEISLHAANLETRQHIWGKDFSWPDMNAPCPVCGKTPCVCPTPPPQPYPQFLPSEAATADLAVHVAASVKDDDSSDLASELLSLARETIGAQGFQVTPDEEKADVILKLAVTKTVFDRTGNYAVMEGGVRATATVPARRGFFLGETRIDRERGERRLGDRDAMLSVRDIIEPKLVSWIGQNITAEKTGITAVLLPFDVSMLDENQAAKFISDICAEAVKIPGFLGATLAQQTPEMAVFRMVYAPDRLPEGPENALRARHPEYFPVPEEVL